jgi:hypothetical protein
MDPASSKNPPPHLHDVKLIVMSLSLSQGKTQEELVAFLCGQRRGGRRR